MTANYLDLWTSPKHGLSRASWRKTKQSETKIVFWVQILSFESKDFHFNMNELEPQWDFPPVNTARARGRVRTLVGLGVFLADFTQRPVWVFGVSKSGAMDFIFVTSLFWCRQNTQLSPQSHGAALRKLPPSSVSACVNGLLSGCLPMVQDFGKNKACPGVGSLIKPITEVLISWLGPWES